MHIPDSHNLIQLKQKNIKKIREKLLREQSGICPICHKEIKRPVLDHDHKKRIKGTGRCRGVICSSCNVFLAKIENNSIRYNIKKKDLPEVLINISKYLSAPQTKYIHPSEISPLPKLQKRCFNKLNKEYKKRYPKKKLLQYPKSGKLTKKLKEIFRQFHIQAVFYGEPLVAKANEPPVS